MKEASVAGPNECRSLERKEEIEEKKSKEVQSKALELISAQHSTRLNQVDGSRRRFCRHCSQVSSQPSENKLLVSLLRTN